MYPHIIIAFNIERNTMIGKLIIEGFDEDRYEHFFINNTTAVSSADDDDDDEEDGDDSLSLTYDAGKDYVDNIICGDIISIGTKWHNLPDFAETYSEFKRQMDIKPKVRLSLRSKIKKFIDIIDVDI